MDPFEASCELPKKQQTTLKNLIRPLQSSMSIDYLCITLVTDDCHYSILTNDVRLQEYFIENKLYIQHPVFTHPKLYKQGLILPEHFGLERFQCTQGQVNQNFDINSIVSLNIGNHRQALCFHFMSRACEQLYKLLAMGTHILYKYVDFFLKNYQALIQELKNNLVDTSVPCQKYFFESPHKKYLDQHVSFLKHLGLSQQTILGVTTLTEREKHCIKYYLRGHSAREIAAMLSLSSRTIESHLTSIKNKLNCKKRSELLELLQICSFALY